MKPKYELAQIISQFAENYYQTCSPNSYIQRTLKAIELCRTSALGGHIDACQECGHIRISYNSCRNRHCPKCQNTQKEAWIENRKKWFARIYINKQIYLGLFTDEKQAAKAYQTALEMHEAGEVVTGAMVRQKISN